MTVPRLEFPTVKSTTAIVGHDEWTTWLAGRHSLDPEHALCPKAGGRCMSKKHVAMAMRSREGVR